MTPDERRMLSDLADKFAKTPAPPKDPEAEEFIRTRIGNRPDALYLMTQAVLVQNLALQQAQQQLQALQRGGASSGSSSGSFLGQSGSPSGSSFSQSSGQGQYSAPPQYAQASTPTPSAGAAPSFLRGAAQTAAGVAAGALAFEGIRSLFSHPGYGMGNAGFGGFGGGYGFGGGAPVDETIVNNYYDNSGGGGDTGNLDLQDNRDNFSDTGQSDNADYTDNSSDVDNSSDFGGFDDGGDNFS